MSSTRIDGMTKRDYDMKVENSIIHLMAVLTPHIIERRIVVHYIGILTTGRITFYVGCGDNVVGIIFNIETLLWSTTMDRVLRKSPDAIVKILVRRGR